MLATARQLAVDSPLERPPGQIPPASGRRILVVDDEPMNRALLLAILTAEGHEVVQAEDGHAALEIIASQPVDLVILDLLMPGIDGIETCRRLRVNLGKSLLPVIFATALTDRSARIRAKETGADDFLVKPIDELELRVRLNNLFKIKSYYELRESQREALEANLEEARLQIIKLDRLATLGTLAAGVGHELSNIASVLAGFDSLLARGAPGSMEQGDLDDFRHAVDHLTAHAKQLLSLGKPTSERVTAHNLCAIVNGTLSMLRLAGRTKYVQISAEWSKPEIWVQVNRTRVEQVLVNLIGNAVDALKEVERGPKEIRVVIETVPGRALCRVVDNGIGVPESKLESIFMPFFTTKAPGAGTGLGLPVSRRIVESYGGRLVVRSQEGKGTTFEFDLPLEQI